MEKIKPGENEFTITGFVIEKPKPFTTKTEKQGTEFLLEYEDGTYRNAFTIASFTERTTEALKKAYATGKVVRVTGRIQSRLINREDGTGAFYALALRPNVVEGVGMPAAMRRAENDLFDDEEGE